MIKDFVIEFEYKKEVPITVSFLENLIKENKIEPVRYAIIEKKSDIYKLLVSGIKL